MELFAWTCRVLCVHLGRRRERRELLLLKREGLLLLSKGRLWGSRHEGAGPGPRWADVTAHVLEVIVVKVVV